MDRKYLTLECGAK